MEVAEADTATNGNPEGENVEDVSKSTAKTDTMEGRPNGSIQPSLSESVNTGRSRDGRRPSSKKTVTWTGWTLDKGLKVFVWYIIFTVAFRCPSEQKALQENTPAICLPYLQTREYIRPYTQPYYDQYLAPQVEKLRTYLDQVNERVVNPGLKAYHEHGAPFVEQTQKHAAAQWEKTIKPQLEVARQQAGKQYDALLGPQVKQAQDVVQPYYDSFKTSARDIWELELQPVYRNAEPVVRKLITQGQTFAVDTVLPQAQYASSAAWALGAKQFWPRLQVLYGENIEPQLMRIRERLGRYRDEKKLQAEIKSLEISSSLAQSSTSASSLKSSLSSFASAAAESPVSAVKEAASASPTPSIDPREQFGQDLKSWEAACSLAVAEGAEHLRSHIKEIAEHQYSSQVKSTGTALLSQLSETANGVINSVKARILAIVSAIPEEASQMQLDEATQSLTQAIRNAGQNVKSAAQAVRDWKSQYHTTTDDLVSQALQSTLETIDEIREIRLSEIGRKYADAGLSHKDWSQYNKLKKATQAWRDDVAKVVNENVDVQHAKEAAEDIEHEGMRLAEGIAKELGRLKEVGKWKVEAGDASDDFNSKNIPAAAERVRKKVMDTVAGVAEQSPLADAMSAASSAVLGKESSFTDTLTDAVSSASSALSSVADQSPIAEAMSAASSAMMGTESSLTDSLTDATSVASSSVSSALSSLSSAVADQPVSSSLGSKAASILEAGRRSKENASKGSATDVVSASPSSVAAEASSSLFSAYSGVVDSVSDAAASVKSAGSKVFAGANAQVLVEARDPILDDTVDEDASYSARIQSILDAAHDQATELTQAVLEAMGAATPTPTDFQGSASSVVSSMTSLASEQYESALSAASSVLFGTAAEEAKGSQAAKDLYLSAVTAASNAIYGAPTTAATAFFASSISHHVAGAQSRYSEALSQAAAHYEAAKSQVSVQISGTPKPVHEQMFASVESAYSDALAAASSRLDVALSAVSRSTAGLFATKTQGPLESISSIASSRLAEALSAASSQYSSAKIALGVEPTPVHHAYLAEAQKAYYQGIGYAHDQYSSFLAAASSAVGATPTTGYQAYLAAAQSTFSAAMSAASASMQGLLGASPTSSGALDSISAAYDSAVAAASSQLAAASSQASAMMYGTPTIGYEAYVAAAQSTYSAAVAAASSNLQELFSSASSTTGALDSISASYDSAIAAASSQLAAASRHASEYFYGTSKGGFEQATEAVGSMASSALYGSETPYIEAMASQASQNWESLISRASEQIYGQPPPFTASLYTQASVYAAQATSAAAEQYEAIQSLFSELVSGKEPDFTDSVMSRLHSAYYTGAPAVISSASSYISDAYASASSAVVAVFTPPPSLENLVQQVRDELDSAVAAASEQFYGTPTGTFESATSAVADGYSSASASVSSALYGHETGYAEAMSSSFAAIASRASQSVSEAIYGTPTGTLEAASASAASVYSSLTSVASAQAASISSAVSVALYGEEKSYVEKMNEDIAAAVESARKRIVEFGGDVSGAAKDTVSAASSMVEEVASSVASVVSEATERVRDEL